EREAMKTSPPHILASGRGRCRSSGPLAHRASAVLSYAAGAAHHRRLSWRRRGDVPTFATVNVSGREHEPLPLLLPFSHGDSEVKGERYESRLEPSPRTRGYATLRPTSCLCPARRQGNCLRAKAVRQEHGCLAASTFSLLDL